MTPGDIVRIDTGSKSRIGVVMGGRDDDALNVRLYVRLPNGRIQTQRVKRARLVKIEVDVPAWALAMRASASGRATP